jgi:hypothetical protein
MARRNRDGVSPDTRDASTGDGSGSPERRRNRPETPEQIAARTKREQQAEVARIATEARERERAERARGRAEKIAEAAGRLTEDDKKKDTVVKKGQGNEMFVFVKDAEGNHRDILDILGKDVLGEFEIKLVAGSNTEAGFAEIKRDDSVREVTVSENMPPGELPFLVREIVRAANRKRKKPEPKTKKRKGRPEETVMVEVETSFSKIIEKETEARRKYENGLKQIRGDWGRQSLAVLRERYMTLEDDWCKAFQNAEKCLDILMDGSKENPDSGAAEKFMAATGRSLYKETGGQLAFTDALRRRIEDRQSYLVKRYDDKTSQGRLLGRVSVEIETGHDMTNWDAVPVISDVKWLARRIGGDPDLYGMTYRKRFFWDGSQTVRDFRFRQLLRGDEDGVSRATKAATIDLASTFGKDALLYAGGVLITGAELALRPFGWTSDKLFDWLDSGLKGFINKHAKWMGKQELAEAQRDKDKKWKKERAKSYGQKT